MKIKSNNNESGNVLICVLGAILVVSLIGANVLRNSTTRLNSSSNQVRAWKEALSAAEAGGDMAFAELRKTVPGMSPTPSPSPWMGWTNSGTTHVSPVTTYGKDWNDPLGTRNDPAAIGATPQISRRIEQIVTPVTPFFDAAIKASASFYGLGSAAMLDSYDSRKGPYVFVANDPTNPRYPDSRHGSLQIGSSTATVKGMLYGDVATNGGTIVGSSQITGTVDNNVPFNLDDYHMPDTSAWAYQPAGTGAGKLPLAVSSSTTLTPPAAGRSEERRVGKECRSRWS